MPPTRQSSGVAAFVLQSSQLFLACRTTAPRAQQELQLHAADNSVAGINSPNQHCMLCAKQLRGLLAACQLTVWAAERLVTVLCAVVAGLCCTEAAVLCQVPTLAAAPAGHTLWLVHIIKVPAGAHGNRSKQYCVLLSLIHLRALHVEENPVQMKLNLLCAYPCT
jgi:hypothetical protein